MKNLKIISTALLLLIFSFIFAEALGQKSERYFEFVMRPDYDQNFITITSDTDVISLLEQQLALSLEERNWHINGAIDYGNGGHNLGWGWHFIPNEWIIAQASIEICDGNPDMIEEDLYYWIDILGSFCPWNSVVYREIPGICGDANRDGAINISDAVFITNYVFTGGDPPVPYITGDVNCDGTANVSDAVWIVNYVFIDGNDPCDADGDGEPEC